MTYPTQEIPTDRHGNIYYGPTTTREAEELIQTGDVSASEVTERLVTAGYLGVAARVRKIYGLTG